MKDPAEILPGMEIVGLTLYLRKDDALVFGDLHLGFEEELNELGYLVPRFQYKEIIRHLDEVFKRIGRDKVGMIIINGDLKHEFGRISGQEWREVLDLIDYVGEHSEETILVRGNHDTVLGPIAGKKDVKVVDGIYLKASGTYVTHGHRIPEDPHLRKASAIVIGHGHPALTLRDEARAEKVKCFIKSRYDGKDLIQIPALSFVTQGSELMQDETFTPFMEKVGEGMAAWCVEGFDVFFFGRT